MSLDFTDYINFVNYTDREELRTDVTTAKEDNTPADTDYTDREELRTDVTPAEELRTDVMPAKEDSTPADTADTIRALAKARAPSNISITFDGGSKHDREVAMKEAAADADTIIAAHPKGNYRLVLERIAAKYDVTNVRFVGDDSVEIQLATPLPPAPHQWRDGEWGRSPQPLDKGTAEAKQPDLFDDKEIALRDAEAARLAELYDLHICSATSTTPITLSSLQHRIVYALAAFISRPEELARDDVQRKIRKPYAPRQYVGRWVPLEFLARMIYGSNRSREREMIRNELYTLAHLRQFFHLRDKWFASPLIALGAEFGKSKGKGIDRTSAAVEIIFGGIFFDGLDNRYAPINPRSLFAAWRKAGRGTELFSRLYAELRFIYTTKKRQEAAIREGIKQEAAKARKTLTAAAIERRARAEMQRKKLQYTRINVETLKRKIGRDYESKVQYTADFWRDLDAAIEGLKEEGIITAASSTAATAQPGTKRKLRPQQIVFTINLDYDKAATAAAVKAEEVAAPPDDSLPSMF